MSIGSGETELVRLFARAARALRARHPDIRYRISAATPSLCWKNLDKGLIDFGLLFGGVDVRKYDTLPMPACDRWGVLMRRTRRWRRRRPSARRTSGTSR